MFGGSYYDPTPWLDSACAAAYAVPAGCPLPFVTAGDVGSDELSVTAARGSDVVSIDATLMLDGSDVDQPISGAKDVYSCTCDPEQASATFDRYELDAATLEPGDYVTVDLGPFGTLGFEIGSAAACQPIDWPTEFDAGIACDDCPVDDGSGSGSGSGNGSGNRGAVGDDDPAGCDASGGAPLWIGLAALVLVRRRRQSIAASSSRLRA
jgi:uncharacterized protein (TIGR03382 family)